MRRVDTSEIFESTLREGFYNDLPKIKRPLSYNVTTQHGDTKIKWKASYDGEKEYFLYPSLSREPHVFKWKVEAAPAAKEKDPIELARHEQEKRLKILAEKGEGYLREALKSKHHENVLKTMQDQQTKQNPGHLLGSAALKFSDRERTRRRNLRKVRSMVTSPEHASMLYSSLVMNSRMKAMQHLNELETSSEDAMLAELRSSLHVPQSAKTHEAGILYYQFKNKLHSAYDAVTLENIQDEPARNESSISSKMEVVSQPDFLARYKRLDISVQQHQANEGSVFTAEGAEAPISAEERVRMAQDAYLFQCLKSNILPESILSNARGTSLNLSHFGVGDELGIALSKSLKFLTDLEEVNLADNRLSKRSLNPIIEDLPRLKVRVLNFGHNDMRRCCETLSRYIPQASVLMDLTLNKSQLTSADVKALSEALLATRTLKCLDLSSNMISDEAIRSVSHVIHGPECSVENLNLSWNNLTCIGAKVLGRSLAMNKNLKTLSLAGNRIGDDGGQVVVCALATHRSLTELDLTRTSIRGRTCFVASKVCRGHPSLQKLNLTGNSVGESGGRSIFRAILRHLRTYIIMRDCLFPDDETEYFDNSNPSSQSPFRLELSDPYQAAVFEELCQMVKEQPACRLENVAWKPPARPSQPLNLTAELGEIVDRKTRAVFVAPTEGVLTFSFYHELMIPSLNKQINQEALNTLKGIVINAATEEDRKNWLRLLCKDAYFTTAQAQDIIDSLQSHSLIGLGSISKMDIIMSIYSRILDFFNVYDFLCNNLTPHERTELAHLMTFEKYKFMFTNPTTSWRLDLSLKSHREVLQSIHAVHLQEMPFSKNHSKRGDTSQKGNWCNFRNERLNREPFELTVEWCVNMPRQGTLEFDYVSTTRPPRDARPVTDQDLEDLRTKLGLSLRRRAPKQKVMTLLLDLQVAASRYWFTSHDILGLLDCFPEDDETQASVLVSTFGRLVDLENFDIILRVLTQACIMLTVSRLGWLNIMNPLKTAHDYRLNLLYRDERVLVRMLLDLAASEGGDNLKEDAGSEMSIIDLYASIGRLQDEISDTDVMFSYVEIGERKNVPNYSIRAGLLKNFLLGTDPIPSRVYFAITQYRELDEAGLLGVGPVDIQYLKVLRKKNLLQEMSKGVTVTRRQSQAAVFKELFSKISQELPSI